MTLGERVQHDWRSIVEEEETYVVLRGLPATVPQSYERFQPRGHPLRIASAANHLRRFNSLTVALIAHLIPAVLLMSAYYVVQMQEDTFVTASVRGGAPAEKPEEKPKPAPVVEPEEKPVEPTPPPEPEPTPPAPDPVESKLPEDPKPTAVGSGATASGPPKVEFFDEDPIEAIRKRRAADLNRLRGGGRERLMVVGGHFDTVEDVLEQLGIPYGKIESKQLEDADLSKCEILLINCDNLYQEQRTRSVDARAMDLRILELEEEVSTLKRRYAGAKDRRERYRLNVLLLGATSRLEEERRGREVTRKAFRISAKIRAFVLSGGYVFTSDWGISILERAFPGKVRNGGFVGPKTVSIHPSGKHALLEMAFPPVGKGRTAQRLRRWEVDSSSYLIRIDGEGVETLVESDDLARHKAVAVVFGEGKGKALHILSHFKRQATRAGDFALQNMLLNFMLERMKR